MALRFVQQAHLVAWRLTCLPLAWVAIRIAISLHPKRGRLEVGAGFGRNASLPDTIQYARYWHSAYERLNAAAGRANELR